MSKIGGVIKEGKPGHQKRKQTPCSLLGALRGRRMTLTIQRTRTLAGPQRCSSAKILGVLMTSTGPEDQGGRMPSSYSTSFSFRERCRRRRLQRGHRDSPEPTVTATAPVLNRCLTPGYGPLRGSAKHYRPYDRTKTVATPWTPQTGGSYGGAAILVSHDSRCRAA